MAAGANDKTAIVMNRWRMRVWKGNGPPPAASPRGAGDVGLQTREREFALLE